MIPTGRDFGMAEWINVRVYKRVSGLIKAPLKHHDI